MTNIRPMIICDSRGSGIQKIVQQLGYPAMVLVNSGKGIQLSTLAAIPKINNFGPNIITLAGSICDITRKHKTEPLIQPRYDTIDEIVRYYMSELRDSISLLKTMRPNIQIQATTVIGVDLMDVNNRNYKHLVGTEKREYINTKIPHPQQALLDEAVIAINKEVAAININNDVATPWTANAIHIHKGKGRFVTKYDRLTDGCHYGERVQREWVNLLVLSYKKIHKKWFVGA